MAIKHLTDHKTSVRLFLFIWVMYAVVYMTKNCYNAAMASIVSEGIMTKTQTGLIAACFYLSYAPFQVVGGKLADKYPPEMLLLIGLLGAAICNLIVYLNQNYYLMIVVWTFNGAIQFGIWPAIFKIISSQLEKTQRKKAIFYISLSSSSGLALAYICAAFIKNWQNNFLLSAVLLFLFTAATAVVYFFANKKMVTPEEYPEEDNLPSVSAPTKTIPTAKILFGAGLIYLIPAYIVTDVVSLGVKNFAPTMLMESYETISPMIGNFLNVFLIIAGIAGTFIVRAIYPRFIKEELTGVRNIGLINLPLIALCIFVGKISVTSTLVSLCLISVCSSIMAVLRSYYSARFAKYGKNGEVAGIVNACSSLGIVVQSYGLAKVADAFDWSTVFTVISALWIGFLVITTCVLPLWKKFSREN
ncbi:MAG: MFS transporter [Oscillospiraceae bacterium]|nr:MFS transporter [Oscillospiraceae bacterium]